MPRKLNGITRKIASNGASRWATFNATGGGSYCQVSQPTDPVSLTMAAPWFSWGAQAIGKNSISDLEIMAEALRQAIELARKWEADTGKPYGDVLK